MGRFLIQQSPPPSPKVTALAHSSRPLEGAAAASPGVRSPLPKINKAGEIFRAERVLPSPAQDLAAGKVRCLRAAHGGRGRAPPADCAPNFRRD